MITAKCIFVSKYSFSYLKENGVYDYKILPDSNYEVEFYNTVYNTQDSYVISKEMFEKHFRTAAENRDKRIDEILNEE